MNAKHTPGPWIYKTQDGVHAYIHGENLIDGRPGVVAKAILTGNDYSDANARLIAAAPEMLEALEKLNSIWLAHGCAVNTLSCPICNIYFQTKSKDAIAKARGEK